MTDADKLVERLRSLIDYFPTHDFGIPKSLRATIMEAADYIAFHQRTVEAAVRRAVEECARIAGNVRDGYSANIRTNEHEQEFIKDKDGPWVLNADVAIAIRSLLDSPDFWNTINNAAAVQDDSVVNGTNAEREPTAPSVPPAPVAAPINESAAQDASLDRAPQPESTSRTMVNPAAAAPPAPSLELPPYPSVHSNGRGTQHYVLKQDYDALRSTLKAALERNKKLVEWLGQDAERRCDFPLHLEAERKLAEAEKERDEIKSALSRQEGMVMVPREPTPQMIEILCQLMANYPDSALEAYKAMLAAAPQDTEKK